PSRTPPDRTRPITIGTAFSCSRPPVPRRRCGGGSPTSPSTISRRRFSRCSAIQFRTAWRANRSSRSSMPPVAVDILTGFLGSGKTTLLRHVLDHGLRGKPVAVIMNEIGEIGIDGRAITGLSAVEKMVEVSSGCICCQIDDYKFDLAVQEIIETTQPHVIIIESTGLADPEPLVYRVKTAGLNLDAVITVVDAANVDRHLRETEVA